MHVLFSNLATQVNSLWRKNIGFDRHPPITKSNMRFIIVTCWPPEADIHVKQKEQRKALRIYTKQIMFGQSDKLSMRQRR